MKTIAIASDNAGYELKQVIAAHLRTRGYTVNDRTVLSRLTTPI
jgi:ribose 5-phosphate isomerase RpiB